MNQDTDRELDILLRRQGRPSASGMSGAKDANRAATSSGAATIQEHLDADEMSSYAEGALSERARLRYASHLADCDQCRKIVTGLVLSSKFETEESPAVRQAVAAPAARRSWREWLAALFSPPVLRYAAPALALIAFAAIVLVVVTRNRNQDLSVARNGQPRQQQAPASSAEAEKRDDATSGGTAPASPSTAAQPSGANANSAETSRGTVSLPSPELKDQQQQEAAAPAPSVQMDGVSTKDAAKTASDPRNETPAPQARPADTAQKSQPPPSTSTTDTVTNRAKERDDATTLAASKAKEEAAASGAGGGSNAGARPGRASNSGALSTARESTSADKRQNEAARTAPATPAGRSRRGTTGSDEDGAGAATRTVAGKSFRQRNGVWVDSAYNSSRSTTRVRRGSEQYRALVADEPIIGSVANALGGPCIVVTGGRAYYIY